MEKTFSQEQINEVAKSYESEVCKLLQGKVNDRLTILDLRNQLAKLTKENSELKKEVEESKKDVTQ